MLSSPSLLPFFKVCVFTVFVCFWLFSRQCFFLFCLELIIVIDRRAVQYSQATLPLLELEICVTFLQIFFLYYFCPYFFYNSNYTYILLLEVVSQFTDALFIYFQFFSLGLIWDSAYCYTVKFTNRFFCNVHDAVIIPSSVFFISDIVVLISRCSSGSL